MKHLENKVCVITGAAGSIGRESVAVFAREGATVVAIDIRGEVECDLFVAADLTDEAQVRDAYAGIRRQFGRIDVLFNNAGIAVPEDGSVLETDLMGGTASSRSTSPASSCAASTGSRTC